MQFSTIKLRGGSPTKNVSVDVMSDLDIQI